MDATFGGDTLETAHAEWNNHHLVIEGGTLTLPAWRVFENTFHKLRNRAPLITELEATKKVLENLPSKRGETDWLTRVTIEEKTRRERNLKCRVTGLDGLNEIQVKEFLRLNLVSSPKSLTYDNVTGTCLVGCPVGDFMTALKMKNKKYSVPDVKCWSHRKCIS